MAYSDSFPAVRPVFQSDFANGGRIDPRISYSRSTTGTYFGTDKHLSSENLIKHSEGSAVWGGTATITYGYTNGPDGVTGTALRLESASGTERYRYSTGGQFVSGTAYTVSCWVKSNTGVAQTFRFMCSTTANQSADLTTHATDWTRVTATITPNTTNIFAGFVFLSANTNDISVWGLQVNTGSDELDYQATTTQIHREYAPTLQTAAINAPRFEFSATDSASEAIGQSRGLLIEGSSTNLLNYSDDFANNWLYNRVNFAESAAVSPTGQLTADLVYADGTAANTHLVQVPCSVTAATHTFSVYAKSAGCQYIRLSNITTGSGYGHFDLINGTVTSSSTTATIESVGNGWYRCSITETHTAGYSYLRISLATSPTSVYWDGDNYSGVLLWGAQNEANSFPSSLISCNGSATTRAADSASAVAADIGYTGGPVSFVGEISGGTGTVVTMSDNTGNNRLFLDRPSGNWRMFSQFNGFSNIQTNVTLSGSSSYGKFAARFDTNNAAVSAGGVTPSTDTGFDVPVMNKLNIGSLHDNITQLNGHVKRIALYGEALSDTNLQALTS